MGNSRDTMNELALQGLRTNPSPRVEPVVKANPEPGVLVVEDDPETQWRLARMLTVHGARVVGTSSGEAALAVIEQWPADLVLLDDGLPGISGLDVMRQIRLKYPEMPVVMMSGEESADLRHAASIAGAFDTLVKPFRREVLIDLFARLRGVFAPVASRHLRTAPFDTDLAPAE